MDDQLFDHWNQTKKRLARLDTPPSTFPQEGEVWICSLGWNLGREQNGSRSDFSRPALVVKKFNNEIFWIAPLSTKQKPLDFYFNFRDPHDQPVAAIIGQLRLVSINRLQRLMYQLPPRQFAAIRAALLSLLS